MTNPTKNLIVNIIIAWIVWMLTIATAYGTYCLYNAYGMNWGALIGIIVTSLLLLLATGSIGVVFESYKSDKRSKQAEEKLEYLEKHCLNALKHKGIKKYIYNYISSLSTDEEKIIRK